MSNLNLAQERNRITFEQKDNRLKLSLKSVDLMIFSAYFNLAVSQSRLSIQVKTSIIFSYKFLFDVY